MDLTVTSETKSGRTIIHLAGEVDVSTAARLRDELDRAIADGTHNVVVDLLDVPFLDSTGLGVLVGRLKTVRLAGGDMALVMNNERVLRGLRITGLDKVFTIYPSLKAVDG